MVNLASLKRDMCINCWTPSGHDEEGYDNKNAFSTHNCFEVNLACFFLVF